VSLRALEATVKAGGSQAARRLCGITRVTGFVTDQTSRDIILLGEVDPGYPPLYLDDFVVALRNSRRLYAERRGRMSYYWVPGCSIDPDPKVLGELQKVSDQLRLASDAKERRECLDEWQNVGRQQQKVRVMGVPGDTRFARVMVDADYYMKHIADGSVTLGMEGFESVMDMAVAAARKDHESGVGLSSHTGWLNRFWFCPGDATYTEDDGVVLLASCPMKLLTEQELLTSRGQVAGSGRANALAKRFADSFTDNYQQIAARKPIYKELEGLFRFVGVANLIRDTKASQAAGLGLRYLADSYQVAAVPVGRTLPGITNLREIEEKKETGDGGYTLYHLWQVSCGGVNMDVRPRRIAPPNAARAAGSTTPATRADSTPGARPAKPAKVRPTASAAARQPSGLRRTVLAARKSAKALYWDFGAVK
jgi:hypothetical protein